MDIARPRKSFLWLCLQWVLSFFVAGVMASEPPETADTVAVQRFTELLMRQPRRGVALDRVYAHHVQNQSLDDFLEKLETDEDQETEQISDAERGKRWFLVGLLQSRRGNDVAAEAALGKAEANLNEDALVRFERGRALIALGQSDRAIEALKRSIDREPARRDILAIYTLLAQTHIRRGDTAAALEVWRELETRIPDDFRIRSQVADALARQSLYAAAQERYAELANIARSPDQKLDAEINAATMLLKMEQVDPAREQFEELLSRLRPGSWRHRDVRDRLEGSFLDAGDYGSLADYYFKKLASAPDDLPLRIRLGNILGQAGRLDEARRVLEDAMQRAPENAPLRMNLIAVLKRMRDSAAVAKQYEQWAKQEPDNPDVLLQWGDVVANDRDLDLRQRNERAIAIWKRLADARRDDPVMLARVAESMRSIDAANEAISIYRQAIRVAPDSSQYREYLGEYLFRLKRTDEALEVWRSMVAGELASRESWVRLAEVLDTFGLDDPSLEAWEQAAKLDLNFAQRLRYAEKLGDAKRFHDALTTIQGAAELAETPEDREQCFALEVQTHLAAGDLSQQIAKQSTLAKSADDFRRLALMRVAAGDGPGAAEAIGRAMRIRPGDLSIAEVAADIAQQQSRWSDAIDGLSRLADGDARYRSSYLQRIAQLEIKLGRFDAALEAAEKIIETNPASPDHYLTFARIAFEAGKDDEAFDALRRAMHVAPRDTSARRMLASKLAERYATEEAIELYWQAFEMAGDLDAKQDLLVQLAPLYQRRLGVNDLLARIQARTRRDASDRETGLLLATVHETVNDPGAAAAIIERLLSQKPRDVHLLELMSRLSVNLFEVDRAVEYQERVVQLSDTPEHRDRLLELRLRAGHTDAREAVRQRQNERLTVGEVRGLIQRCITRQDAKATMEACQLALDKDPDLWDVKLLLAQTLIFLPTENDLNRSRAFLLLDEILSADRDLDEVASPAKPAQSVRDWSVDTAWLAFLFRLEHPSGQVYSWSARFVPIAPRSFGHARVTAGAIRHLIEVQRNPEGARDGDINSVADQIFPVGSMDDANITESLLANVSLAQCLRDLRSPGDGQSQEFGRVESYEKRIWKLLELDPDAAIIFVDPILQSRTAKADRIFSEYLSDQAGWQTKGPDILAKHADRLPKPLSPNRLAGLERSVQHFQRRYQSVMSGSSETDLQRLDWLRDWRMRVRMEALVANDVERLKRLEPAEVGAHNESFAALESEMIRCLNTGDLQRAEACVPLLMPAARRRDAFESGLLSQDRGRSGIEQMRPAFFKQHGPAIFDARLACIASEQHRVGRNTGVSIGGGVVEVARLVGKRVCPCNVLGPLSDDLLTQSELQLLFGQCDVWPGLTEPTRFG
ncbi:MAG: tetratricopeptide repeat protein, partial [Planctomycetota bacterium]